MLQSLDSGAGPVGGTQQQPIIERSTNNGQTNNAGASSRSITQEFVDLGARIQLINQASNNVIRELTNQGSKSDNRHGELLQKLATRDQVSALDARLQRMDQMLQAIQRDLEGKDYKDKFNQLQETLRSSHLSLSESLHGTVYNGMSARLNCIQVTHMNSNYLFIPKNGLLHHSHHRFPTSSGWVIYRLQAPSG